MVELDGQRCVGDVDGDRLAGVDAAEGDLLTADHDHAAVRGPALEPDRLGRGPRRWPGGPVPTVPADLLRAEGVRPNPAQLSAVRSKNIQRVGLDPDADLTAAEDLLRQDLAAAEADQPVSGDNPFDLNSDAFLDRCSGEGPAPTTLSATSRARSVTLKCERTVLTGVPPMNR